MINRWLDNIIPIYKTVIAWIAENNIASVNTAIAVGFSVSDEFEY